MTRDCSGRSSEIASVTPDTYRSASLGAKVAQQVFLLTGTEHETKNVASGEMSGFLRGLKRPACPGVMPGVMSRDRSRGS